MRREDGFAVAAIIAAWVAAVVLVDPRADVSLIDDWLYAFSVEQLLDGKGFHISPWSSTFPVVQLWWGALFAWLGGFSFTTLRLSTLVLWLFGTLSVYGALRALGGRPFAAWFGALVVFLYPVFFVLAFSFMTDVPFLAMTAASLGAMAAGLRTGRWSQLQGGLALAFVAFLIRPVAVALPAGLFVAAVTLDSRLRTRVAIASLVTVIVMVVASTVIARLFPWGGDGGVAYRVMRLSFILLVPPIVYVEAGLSMLSHVGLAVVPVLLAFGPPPRRAGWGMAVVLVVAAVAVSYVAPSAVSALKYAHTVGPEELGAARPLLQGAAPRGPIGNAVALLATGIGLGAGGFLLERLASGFAAGGRLRRPAWICVVGFGAASAAICFVIWFFYDRYYLPLVLVATTVALADGDAPVAGWRRRAGVGLLVVLAVIDVTGTRDMLAYQRAVAASAARLRAEGIPEIELDAGYVENGWRLYAHPERLPAGKDPTLDVPHVTAKADGLPYVIANGVLPGYRVRETVTVPTWWAVTDRLYVLERE